MKGTSIIFILMMTITFSGFSQEDAVVDSTTFESKCDCLEAEYFFKKELLENLTFDEGETGLSTEFIEKYSLTWPKLEAIRTQCDQLTHSENDAETCPYGKLLCGISDDFELILRVIEMKRIPHGNY